MENAVDALKMGFAVLVFVMALSLVMSMFSQARATADAVLHSSDVTAYMEYTLADENNRTRTVGLETIIPTLYKYYKEDYTVIFREQFGQFMELYKTKTNIDNWSRGYINKYYGNKDTRVCSFDISEEDKRHEPWSQDPAKNKEMLDKFLTGNIYEYNDFNGSGGMNRIKFDESFGGQSFVTKYQKRKFKEDIGEYTINNANSGFETNSTKKRVIIYTLLP